jgi:hypothetical protein
MYVCMYVCTYIHTLQVVVATPATPYRTPLTPEWFSATGFSREHSRPPQPFVLTHVVALRLCRSSPSLLFPGHWPVIRIAQHSVELDAQWPGTKIETEMEGGCIIRTGPVEVVLVVEVIEMDLTTEAGHYIEVVLPRCTHRTLFPKDFVVSLLVLGSRAPLPHAPSPLKAQLTGYQDR